MLTLEYFKKTFQVSPFTDIPIYSQISSYIKIQIQSGVLKTGDKMLTENELCEALQVSRTTIRQSLAELVEEGLLVRHRGRGSYIAEKKIERNINYLYNFTESIINENSVPSSVVICCKKVIANEFISNILQMPETNKSVFVLERLRCADGLPIIKETTYIPYFLCPDIEIFDFSTVSLYEKLRSRYSLSLIHAVEKIEAVIMTEKESKELQCDKKVMPGFKINRISYLGSGVVFEYTESITRADKCGFQVDLYANSKKPVNRVDFTRNLNP